MDRERGREKRERERETHYGILLFTYMTDPVEFVYAIIPVHRIKKFRRISVCSHFLPYGMRCARSRSQSPTRQREPGTRMDHHDDANLEQILAMQSLVFPDKVVKGPHENLSNAWETWTSSNAWETWTSSNAFLWNSSKSANPRKLGRHTRKILDNPERFAKNP